MAKEEAKPQATEEPQPSTESEAPKKKGKFGLIGLVDLSDVTLIPVVGIFLAMKFLGADPDPTVGMEQALVPTTKPWEESQEIPVAKVRVLNSNGARAMLYNVRVVVRVHHENLTRVEEFVKGRAGTVEDAIGRVIRSSDERHLPEPGLETLKRQVRHELGKLLGDEELIEQVLIPDCMPMPTGF